MRAAALFVFLLTTASGENWTSFRGPNGSGVSSEAAPVEIGPDKNVVWKIPVPAGTSSPVLTADRIFLTAWEPGKLVTLALHRETGRLLWRREIPQPREEQRHNLNSPASSTPVTDGVNVYVFFGDFGLAAYGPDGKELWLRPMGPFANLHGMGASPVLAGNRLLLVCDQDTDSYAIAVDKRTGETLWKIERPQVVHGFSTPTLFEPDGGELQLIVPGSYQLLAYSVATGKELWSVRGLTWQMKTTAVVDGGTILASGWAPGADPGQRKPVPAFEEVLKEGDTDGDGKLSPEEVPPRWRHTGSWRAIDLNDDGFLDAREWGFYRARREAQNLTLAVRPGTARGDLTESHVLWRNERWVPQVSSPLVLDGILYTIKDGGILTSMNAATGETHKTARLNGAIDAYYSSPVAAGGLLYVGSEKGKLAVVRAGAEWELVRVNDMEEPVYATPAVSGGRIYLRTASRLYCFGGGS
jgi:outer membrane protein assembly factor BamB